MQQEEYTPWWMKSVVYQIYPRSFQDTNGDGIGDLQGIIQRLDYIRELGANVIWLCPVYASPNDDNGYDISDYQAIMAEFGTMADFDELLLQAHARGLRIVMDLVINHTSDEHPWFVESKATKNNPRRDYYIWREGDGSGPPNQLRSVFSGPAWEKDAASGQYYLHIFSPKQPDLNWENPATRRDIYKMVDWWCQKGVDGFRLDTVNLYSKKPELLAPGATGQGDAQAANGPRIHEYIREMGREVFSKYDLMTVGEAADTTPAEAIPYAKLDGSELNMVFQFEHVALGRQQLGYWHDNRADLVQLKAILSRWQTVLRGKAWNSLYWTNHDQPRSVSRFGDDTTPLYWEKSAKMLATCLHMMQGTPYIYQGEEIGMTNYPYTHVEQCRDIMTRNAWHELVEEGGLPPKDMLRFIRYIARDHARTPMQWDAGKNAGFSSVRPWCGVNPNYKTVNAKVQMADSDSIFHHYKKLIALRHKHDIIIHGGYGLLLPEHKTVFAYVRQYREQKLLVLCNFEKWETCVEIPGEFAAGELIIANYEDTRLDGCLRAYEAKVVLLKQ